MSSLGSSGELHPLVALAKATVESYVIGGEVPDTDHSCPEMEERAGVFVSIKKSGALRGCIGTFEPAEANVAREVIVNAISSASQDPRFPPVSPSELGELSYNVDILTPPEPVQRETHLDPRRFGVIVESGRRRGLLLPDLDGIDTVEEQINICRQKAGILPHETVRLYRFEVKRYSSM